MTKDEALKIIEKSEWLADKIVAFGDYGQEAALRLRQLAQMQREALEQPAQEPVAWMDNIYGNLHKIKTDEKAIPLYTHPHQWVGLTNDEMHEVIIKHVSVDCSCDPYEFARAIEQLLKDKNT